MKRALVLVVSIALVSSLGAVQGQQPPPKPAQPASPAQPAVQVEVKTTEAIHALVAPMKGSFMQHEEAFGRIFAHLGEVGQPPMGAPFGRYFNSPGMVAEAELTWEAGVAVGADVKAAAGLEIKDIPAGLHAVVVHAGPYESSGAAIGPLMQWVGTNGYEPAGPLVQLYLGDPGSNPRTEIRLPVQKR